MLFDDNTVRAIIQRIEEEDTDKIFTGEMHPNIYDAVEAISSPLGIKEIERAIRHYFEQVIQITQPETRVHFEAQRILSKCDSIFSLVPNEEEKSMMAVKRDICDEIADFYMESLKHFASFVEEDILFDHIKYLEE